MMLVSLISYIDRNTLALLAPTILKETNLNAEQYGWIISAFSVAYMIGNPIWGRLLDRFGVALGMVAAVGFWTLASVSHAFAVGFWTFAIARAALGFGEGATFPGGLRTVTHTLPAHLQSRGIAVAYSGGALGAVITPILITPIALKWGWRGAFWFTGFIGALWILIWVALTQVARIGRQAASTRSSAPLPSLRDRRLWSFMVLYAMGSLPLAFVLYGAAIYLGRAMNQSQATIGKLLWIPPLGWEIGYYVWGWIVDRTGMKQTGRFGGLFFLLALLSLPLALATHIPSAVGTMALMSFAMFIAAGFIISTVAYGTAAFTTEHSGLLAGLSAGAWSAMVALVMPVFGRLFDQRNWDGAFALAAVFPLLGWVLWRGLSQRVAR